MKMLICAAAVLAVSTIQAGVVVCVDAANCPTLRAPLARCPFKTIECISATLSFPTAKTGMVMMAALLPGDCGIPIILIEYLSSFAGHAGT